MKRNVFLTVVLIVFILLLILGTVYLNDPGLFSRRERNDLQNSVRYELVKYHVSSGKIVHTCTVEGQVVSQLPEIYVERMTVEGVTNESFQILCSRGDVLKPGDELFTFKGKTQKITFNGKIVAIKYTDEEELTAEIEILNFDKLFIATNVNADRISQISYDTVVEVRIDGAAYPSEVMDIGYEIVDGGVTVLIKTPINTLPGTPVQISFILDVTDGGLYVPAEAVYQDGDSYFANVLEGENVVQRRILAGQFFSAEEDGVLREYVEILSGAEEGEVLVVEQILPDAEQVKEFLDRE